jgi:ribonuclease D
MVLTILVRRLDMGGSSRTGNVGARRTRSRSGRTVAERAEVGTSSPPLRYSRTMTIRLIDRDDSLNSIVSLVQGHPRISLDCEAAGFHRYTDRLSLVQLTAGPHTFLLDPLAIDPAPLLAPLLGDAGIEVIMHGADYDVRLLDRDLGLHLSGLFDTQIAASLLGEPGIGLSALLQRYFGIQLSKKYQRADWAQRPLTEGMREYAAHDTLHLEGLRDLLGERLEAAGRLAWAEEEFRALERIRFEAPSGDEDPATRVKLARDLEPRELERLRAALLWRDTLARTRDKAPFRIAGDSALVHIARVNPTSIGALADTPELNAGMVRGPEGEALLTALEGANAIPDAEARPLPRPQRVNGTGRGRPLPEVEERFLRLKEVRNRVAEAMGIDRGTVVPNAVLQALADTPPASLDALSETPGLRRWQAELVGAELLAALKRVG